MGRVLIVYDSVSGSTGDIAKIIFDELKSSGSSVDLRMVKEVDSIAAYDALIIGAPMRFGGFISTIKKFIKKNKDELSRKKVYYFQTCLYVIQIEGEPVPDVPFYADPSLGFKLITKKEKDLFDKTHSIFYYLKLLKKISSDVKPVEIAFFNGRLDLSKLNIFLKIFMRIVTWVTIRERIGDFINPQAAKEWAKNISANIKP